ncbi:MAG TPA: hypothetical protein VEY70_15320 [Metabacillus sp.]|nr:hypothetical protein [Metabacillus sp.]
MCLLWVKQHYYQLLVSEIALPLNSSVGIIYESNAIVSLPAKK